MSSPNAIQLGAAVYYRGLRALGVTAMRRRSLDAGLILCYHNVVAPGDDQIGGPGLHIACDRFEQQMRWLAAHYDVVSLREFSTRLTGRRTARRAMAAVTFDDGYAGVFRYAFPVLDMLGIPATVFLVARAVGGAGGFSWDGDTGLPESHRPADWPSILPGLGERFGVGVHTATHPSLPTLTDADLEAEVVTSRATIHRATGVWPEFFAYPYGHWDARVRARVRAAGYRGALTLDFGLNGPCADRWALRRVNVPATISEAAFEAWTAGLHRPWSA
jgi:peptidoglycan/xylan/chitin deacetylase (PgdA/CDA1 family)